MKKTVRFEIQDMLPIGLTLVVTGIGLAYGINVMSDVSSSTKVLSTTAIINESVATGGALNQGSLLIGASACRNMTNQVPLTLNLDCNVSSTGGVLVNPSNGTTVGIDYTHYTPTTEYNASLSAIKGVAKIPEKMPLIATIIIAAIIIGILVRYLMVRFQ